MPKRILKIAKSLKQLGEIQVVEWDFMALLNKDIGDLEVTRSLRRVGNIKVMEWDFKTSFPAVDRLANQEVDLIGLVKRTANYKVIEWDFRAQVSTEPRPAHQDRAVTPVAHAPNREEIQALITRSKDFLQYVVSQLIDEPNRAQIKVQEIAPNVLRFKLVLVKRDVSMLIGREGNTASAIRSILKASARMSGSQILLEILSHEEELANSRSVVR